MEFNKGTKFPKPIGEEWDKWREKKKADDNANNDATVMERFRDQMCGYEELPNISDPRPR